MGEDCAGCSGIGTKRILIVDDDEAFLSLIELFVRGAGFHVRTALSGEAAIKSLVVKPDAIILDIVMPGCGGVGVLKHLRSMKGSIPPVIAVTSFSGAHHEVQQVVSDPLVSQLLSKPLNPYAFLEVLHGVLGTVPSVNMVRSLI